MKDSKRKKLEAAGWRVGTADEFLGLSDFESMIVDIKLALGDALRERRVRLHMSQRDLAKRINSSQSRVAKMEAADPDVSLELMFRGLAATGAGRNDVAKVIGSARHQGR
jgi:ribosome-binding protein aMBF1 (putative translation factor)